MPTVDPNTPEAVLQEIVLGLEKLKRQAEGAEQFLLAYLIDMALAEARGQSGTSSET